jgi:hypothetical protein
MTPQWKEAMALADEIREERGEMKKRIGKGELEISAALEMPCFASETVVKLLANQHRWGPKRAQKTVAEAMISPFKQCRDLTERQRSVLAEMCERPQS